MPDYAERNRLIGVLLLVVEIEAQIRDNGFSCARCERASCGGEDVLITPHRATY